MSSGIFYIDWNRSRVWLQTLILAITFTVVALVIFLGSRGFRETAKMATEQFNKQQLILARSAAAGIKSYLKELNSALLSLTKLPSIQQMVPECMQYIQNTYWGFPQRTSVRMLDGNGVLRFVYPFDGWRGELIGRDYSKEAFFQKAKETGSITVSRLIINEKGRARIRVAAPVYLTSKTETVRVGDEVGIIAKPVSPSKPESGRFQGILVGSFDPKMIAQDFISPIISGKTGYAWLLDEEGVFVAHHYEGFIGQNSFEIRAKRNSGISYEAIEEIQLNMMDGEEGFGSYISGWHRGQIRKMEKLVAYTPVHISDKIWSVAVCAPVSEVKEIIHMTKRSELYTLTFVILTLMLGGGLFSIISLRWSHSLEQEVKRRTRELRETSDYLNKLIKCANAPIIVWNPERQINIFNQAFERMSGWTEAEMMGQLLDMLFPKENLSDSLQKVERASKGESWENVEIPILRKDGEIRIVLWNSANIYSEDGKILFATISQGQDITERKRAEEELKKSRESLRDLARHLQFIREEERTRISREIHDNLGQELTALKMDLSWLGRRLPQGQKSLFEKVYSMSGLIDGTIQTVQKISTELRPSLLDNLGLAAALEWQAGEFQKRMGIICDLIIDTDSPIFDKERSTVLFRVFQEMLTNIARHAHATKVEISLKEREGNLVLEVRDNGKGITPEQIWDHRSLGLIGMRERVSFWGGEVKISGIRGKGTTVTVTIPA